MNIADELSIPGRIETVYANLIDPEVLKRCIPGCQELEKTSDTDYAAKVILKIGPVKAKFSGNVTLDLSAAPGSLSLAGLVTVASQVLRKAAQMLNSLMRAMRPPCVTRPGPKLAEKLLNWELG